VVLPPPIQPKARKIIRVPPYDFAKKVSKILIAPHYGFSQK
jgi:hypothetical protein